MGDEGKQKIRIFTRQFEIVGDLHIYSGVRLTDEHGPPERLIQG
jgi:hypothetical protein